MNNVMRKQNKFCSNFDQSCCFCIIFLVLFSFWAAGCGSDDSGPNSKDKNTDTSTFTDSRTDDNTTDTGTDESTDDVDENSQSQAFEVPWHDSVAIDGNADDWQEVPVFIEDDIGEIIPEYRYLDITRVWLAQDDEFIYTAVELANDLNLSEAYWIDVHTIIRTIDDSDGFLISAHFSNGPGNGFVSIDYDVPAIVNYPSSYCRYGINFIEYRGRKEDIDLSWNDPLLLSFSFTDAESLAADVTNTNSVIFADDSPMPINANPDTLTLNIGDTAEVTLTGGQLPYAVDTVSNAAVASSLTDETLHVTAYIVGTAQIVVSDTQGDSIQINTTVNAPSAMDVDKCLEVNPIEEAGAGWHVFLRNSETSEGLVGFSLVSISGCIDDPQGNQVLCYRNAVMQQDQLVSFDVILDGEVYLYPADACP